MHCVSHMVFKPAPVPYHRPIYMGSTRVKPHFAATTLIPGHPVRMSERRPGVGSVGHVRGGRAGPGAMHYGRFALNITSEEHTTNISFYFIIPLIKHARHAIHLCAVDIRS